MQKGKSKHAIRPLRLVYVNCQSLRDPGRVAELHAMVDKTKPDILVLVETWLDSSISSSSIFPDYLNMEVYRRDRQNQLGGGVLVAITKDYLSTPVKELETDCESVWAEISLAGAKKLYI